MSERQPRQKPPEAAEQAADRRPEQRVSAASRASRRCATAVTAWGPRRPLEDGAQPLGHAIKGVSGVEHVRSSGDPGYDDAEPDVWFFNEEAAAPGRVQPRQRVKPV